MEKQFEEWIGVKAGLHAKMRTPVFDEGDVWWCSVGENVGIEINGKSKLFSRPVLILRKLGRYGFLGIPLTSQVHVGSWYVNFIFQDRHQVAALAQVRTFSAARLYNRIGVVSDADLKLVRGAFIDLYS